MGAVMVDKTLKQRSKTYGDFSSLSVIANDLKLSMRASDGWIRLEPEHKEALDMIAHKIARIINGDPNHLDSWHDIAGYATLVEQELRSEERRVGKERREEWGSAA